MNADGKESGLSCPYMSGSENRTKAELAVEAYFRSLIIIMLEVRPQNIGCFLLMEGFKQGCTRCQQGYIWRDLDTEVNADPRF